MIPVSKAPPYAGFMAQFAKASREVAELERLYPHACKWATLRRAAPSTRADNQTQTKESDHDR